MSQQACGAQTEVKRADGKTITLICQARSEKDHLYHLKVFHGDGWAMTWRWKDGAKVGE